MGSLAEQVLPSTQGISAMLAIEWPAMSLLSHYSLGDEILDAASRDVSKRLPGRLLLMLDSCGRQDGHVYKSMGDEQLCGDRADFSTGTVQSGNGGTCLVMGQRRNRWNPEYKEHVVHDVLIIRFKEDRPIRLEPMIVREPSILIEAEEGLTSIVLDM